MTGSLRLPVRLGPVLVFSLLAMVLVATEHYVVHRVEFGLRPALGLGVAADLLVVLPGIFYALVVRRYRLPLGTVAAMAGVGLALSYWLLPGARQPLLMGVRYLGPGAEVLALGYSVRRLRQLMQAYRAARQQSAHVAENLLAACQSVLGSRLGTLIATEVIVGRYALLGAWAAPEVEAGEVPFATYRQSGFVAMLVALGGLTVLETGAVHLVLAHGHPVAAWVLTVVGAYSLLWLLAHGQAVRCRPVLLAGQALVLRVGFCWHATIEVAHIAAVRPLRDTPAAAPGLLDTTRPLLTPPNLLLTLAEPQVVRGLFGIRRTVSRLAFYVDEPAALAQQLAARQAQAGSR